MPWTPTESWGNCALPGEPLLGKRDFRSKHPKNAVTSGNRTCSDFWCLKTLKKTNHRKQFTENKKSQKTQIYIYCGAWGLSMFFDTWVTATQQTQGHQVTTSERSLQHSPTQDRKLTPQSVHQKHPAHMNPAWTWTRALTAGLPSLQCPRLTSESTLCALRLM